MKNRCAALAVFLCFLPLAKADTITNVNFSGLLTGTVNQTQQFESYFYLTLSGPTSSFPVTSLQPFSATVPVSASLNFTIDGEMNSFTGQSLVINSASSNITGMSWYSGSTKVLGLNNTIPSILDYSFNQPFNTTTGFAFSGSNMQLPIQAGSLDITGTQFVGMSVSITPDVQTPEPESVAITGLGVILAIGLKRRRRLS